MSTSSAKPTTKIVKAEPSEIVNSLKRKIEQLESEKLKQVKLAAKHPSSLPRNVSNDEVKISEDGNYTPLCIDSVNYQYTKEVEKQQIHYSCRVNQEGDLKFIYKVSENKNKGKAGKSDKEQFINVRPKVKKSGSFMCRTAMNGLIMTPPMSVSYCTSKARGNFCPKQLKAGNKKAVKNLQSAKWTLTLNNGQIYDDRATAEEDTEKDNDRDPDSHHHVKSFLSKLQQQFIDLVNKNNKVCTTFKNTAGATPDAISKFIRPIYTEEEGYQTAIIKFKSYMFRPATQQEIDDMTANGRDAECLQNVPTEEIKTECLRTIPDSEETRKLGPALDPVKMSPLKPKMYTSVPVYRAITLEERLEQYKKRTLPSSIDTPPFTLIPDKDVLIKQDDVVSIVYAPTVFEENPQNKAGLDLNIVAVLWYGPNLRSLSKVPRTKISPTLYYGEVTEKYTRRPDWNGWVALEENNDHCTVPEFTSSNYDYTLGRELTEEEIEERDRVVVAEEEVEQVEEEETPAASIFAEENVEMEQTEEEA
jgi:hypothetical protein